MPRFRRAAIRLFDAIDALVSLFASHVFLALAFGLAWLAPDTPFAADPADGALLMALEGITLLACVLVGGFVELAYVALPLVLGATLLWLAAVGRAAISWSLAGFAWGVVAAFVEGLRAHRGTFGLARANPEHPHRRYDRAALIYFVTLPLPFALWAMGPVRWTIWGTVYFALAAASDSFLRDAIDRVPRAILRRMQSSPSPEVVARLGVCRTCLYVQPAIPQRRGRDVRCQRSLRDSSFPEYPATPLPDCRGYESREVR